MADFLDEATTPFKPVVRKSPSEASPPNSRQVALLTESSDCPAGEVIVCRGETEACRSSVNALMHEGRRIVLDGFPLEEVAELCARQKYRWRFWAGPSGKALRFLIEPDRPIKLA